MTPIFDISEFENPKIKSLNNAQARGELGLPDKTTILFIGRPAFRKGLEYLLEAFSNLTKSDVQLLIVGKGFRIGKKDDINYLGYGNKEIILDQNVIKKILPPFETDSREKLILAYKASDIVVCPSLYEPFGYVNIEALAAQRPVLASMTGGISEIIKDGESGILFSPGSAYDLQTKIEILLNDPLLRKDMGNKGYIQVKNKYNISHQIKEIDNLYDNLVGATI